jgi:hypothetical protein
MEKAASAQAFHMPKQALSENIWGKKAFNQVIHRFD